MNITTLTQCANCGACANICPKQAINIKEDGLFYVPTVDSSGCVDCGACVAVCPVHGDVSPVHPISAYAGWHKQEAIVRKSSSGGAFYGIAQNVLKDGGVVFGAAYSDDCKRIEIVSTDEVSLSQLQKSKYVESLVGDSFVRIKQALENGRRVLFCGTPCQVAGLKRFLKKDHELLLTCDFACGGLPSHAIYQDYLDGLEKKYKSTVKSVDFRPKTHGWKRYAMLINFKNGKKYNRLAVEDPFLKSFLYGKLSVRDYCLECKFSDHHASDISIADFWLHEKLSDLNNADGISLILCNTEKGRNTIESIKEDYYIETIDEKQAAYNYKVTETTGKSRERHDDFLKTWQENGMKFAYHKFFSATLTNRIKNRISRIIFRS